MSVIRLGPDDAGELLTLQRAAWVSEAISNRTLDIPPLHETLDDVIAQLTDPAWRIWGNFDHGRLLATVRSRMLTSSAAYLGRLGVVPDRHGTGLGTMMLRWCEADLLPGTTTIELVTGALSTANHAFYAHHGYQVAGPGDIAGTLVMRKQLRHEDAQAT